MQALLQRGHQTAVRVHLLVRKTEAEGTIIATCAAYELAAIASKGRIPTISAIIKMLPWWGRAAAMIYLAVWFSRHVELW